MFGLLMQLDLGDHLCLYFVTFCLALGFYKFFLLMILRAKMRLSYIRSTVKHSANPPECWGVYLCQVFTVWGSFWSECCHRLFEFFLWLSLIIISI